MLKHRGFGVSEVISTVIGLGAVGAVGYSMVSGECLLGTCGSTVASSASPVSAVGTPAASSCTLGVVAEAAENVSVASAEGTIVQYHLAGLEPADGQATCEAGTGECSLHEETGVETGQETQADGSCCGAGGDKPIE